LPRERKTDQLSSAARQAMLACFAQHLPASMIAAKIKAETGETVADRTVGRRKSEWEAEQQRRQANREQMEDLVAAARGSDLKASEMIEALAREALMRDPDGFGSLNPIDVQRTSLQAEKVRLAREKLELQKRIVDLDEAKFSRMKQREEQAIDATRALERKAASGQAISPDDLRKIREVYGLNT